jgi:pimeloyl-ACP methyl ester carboxylesterase
MRLATITDLQLPSRRRVRVREYAGSGTPLVMLHGLLDSSEGWHLVASRSERPVYAIDLPGFGGSTCPPYDRVGRYARDVGQALDLLGLERYVLVGHSFGGAVATALCEQRPHTVAGLVLIAPVGYGRIGLAELASQPGLRQAIQVGLPFTLTNPVAMTAIYSLWVANGARPDRALVDRCRREAFRVVGGARQALRTIVRCGIDKRAFFRRRVDFHGPVTALWGDRDRLVPVRHAHRVQTTFPHAEVQVWEGMGHHPQRERIGPFSALLERLCRVADAEPVPVPAAASPVAGASGDAAA